MNDGTHDPSMITEAARWRARDLAVLWHPCTQMREHFPGQGPETLPLVPIARAHGAWLVDHDGRRYLDAVSSWWTNLFGHAEPRIAAAIARQAGTLEQVILAGFSHEPAVELAEKLLALAPRQAARAPLAKVFYADNGSAGVEVALKMAFHWFHNRGEHRRTKFVALQNGYHGETIGALAVGDIPLYRRVYAPLLAEALFAPSPDAYAAAPGETAEQCATRAAAALRALLEQHAGEVCALILEPRVQCAGGMRMHDPIYLRHARELCDAHGVLLIADEIAVGFGRTGTLFACEQAGIMPDLLCLSKGLTGGFLPLAAVLATQAIYDGFLDDSRERAFLHSHSYTGNPLACAAALASLSIFDDDDVLVRNHDLARRMAQLAAPIGDLAHVADVRQAGMIVAFELAPEGDRRTAFDPARRIGLRAYRAALERGVVLRPLGDVLYWMPPYCIDEAQLAAAGRDHARRDHRGHGMRLTRIHVDAALAPGTTVTLPEAAAAHLVRVLRLQAGHECVLFNGDGNDYAARIVSAGKRGVDAQVLDARTIANESPLRLSLLQGIARGEKMDWILQKATELGVAAIAPVSSERSEVKLDAGRADKRLAHWRSVVASACEQSGRAKVPDVAPPRSLQAALAQLPAGPCFILDPEATQSIAGLPPPDANACVLAVGPEGGWSPRDRAMLIEAGFSGLRLGPRILRTETAGIAAIAALQSRFGDLA